MEAASQHLDVRAVVQGQVAGRDVFPRRAADAGAGRGFQRGHAADVVRVVVGDEDVAELPVAMRLQPGQYRRGIARIDHGAAARRVVLQQPDVVVAEGGKGVDLKHFAGRQ